MFKWLNRSTTAWQSEINASFFFLVTFARLDEQRPEGLRVALRPSSICPNTDTALPELPPVIQKDLAAKTNTDPSIRQWHAAGIWKAGNRLLFQCFLCISHLAAAFSFVWLGVVVGLCASVCNYQCIQAFLGSTLATVNVKTDSDKNELWPNRHPVPVPPLAFLTRTRRAAEGPAKPASLWSPRAHKAARPRMQCTLTPPTMSLTASLHISVVCSCQARSWMFDGYLSHAAGC